MKYTAKNLEETQEIAGDFVKDLLPNQNSAMVIGLYGDLGAGKTSFTQGIAVALGVTENVVSPTFVIEKIYDLPEPKVLGIKKNFEHLIHIDAYRLDHSDEMLLLGWQEIILNPKNIILIEWPERVADIMPGHIHINFSHISEEGREIEIQGVPLDKNNVIK